MELYLYRFLGQVKKHFSRVRGKAAVKKPNGNYYSIDEWLELLPKLSNIELNRGEIEISSDLDTIKKRMLAQAANPGPPANSSNMRIFQLLENQLKSLLDEKIRRRE